MPQSLSEWALPEEAAAILVALGAGLLIGVERERRMKDGKTAAAAGVRTFSITALLGVLAALSGSHARRRWRSEARDFYGLSGSRNGYSSCIATNSVVPAP